LGYFVTGKRYEKEAYVTFWVIVSQNHLIALALKNESWIDRDESCCF
jgi:hypothetical protein